MKVKNKKMGLTWLIFAFVFLFNPNIAVIDILPDFIGYALICIGISKLADMNDDISTAQKWFSRALIVDIIKMASLLIVFGTQNPSESSTMLLLASFVFAVAELIVLIPAYKALFGGLMGLGYRYKNTSVLGYARRSRKNKTERIRLLTYFFLILKSAAYTLPEFAVLSSQSYDESSHMVYLYDFIGLLRSTAILGFFLVGVVWFISIELYFLKIRNDSLFIAGIFNEYRQNILPKNSIFVKKSVKLMAIFFFVAAVLCFDFRLESFNVIIDPLAALALIIAFFVTRKHIGRGSVFKVLLPFSVYAVISTIATVVEFRFFSKYYYGMTNRSDEAYEAYLVMLAVGVLDALAFVLAVFGMCNIFRGFIKKHTGFYVPSATVNVDEKTEKLHKELGIKVYLVFGSGVLAAATDVFYDFFAKTLRFAGFVNALGTLAFVVVVFSACFTVVDEVKARYMLD